MSIRDFHLQITDEDELQNIVQALNASIRRKIMVMLNTSSYSIAEIAKRLNLPISTVSFHINILRIAGFVTVTVKRNTRGNAKLISRQIDHFALDFNAGNSEPENKTFSMEIPIGSFSDARAEASCGMADVNDIIIADDLPGAFFSPQRFSAQIKAENISKPPAGHLGGKFGLMVSRNDGKTEWPAATIGGGSFDWKQVSFTADIPYGVRSVAIMLGLQGVTGRILFRDLKVEYAE